MFLPRVFVCLFVCLFVCVRWFVFTPCVCLFVCVCVYVCHDVCPYDLTMKDWCHTNKQYFAATLLEMSSCASYVSRTHGVIDDVTRWQSRSKFQIGISPSIFALERRSSAQNVGNANGYLSDIFNFRYNSRWKSLSRAQNGGHFSNLEILNTASIWPQIWKDRPKSYQKSIFHDDDVIDDVTGWPRIRPYKFLYKWNSNIFHDK